MKSNHFILLSKKNLTNSISPKNKIILKTTLLCFLLSFGITFLGSITGCIYLDWKLLFIPAITIFQIVLLIIAIINRYKKV